MYISFWGFMFLLIYIGWRTTQPERDAARKEDEANARLDREYKAAVNKTKLMKEAGFIPDPTSYFGPIRYIPDPAIAEREADAAAQAAWEAALGDIDAMDAPKPVKQQDPFAKGIAEAYPLPSEPIEYQGKLHYHDKKQRVFIM